MVLSRLGTVQMMSVNAVDNNVVLFVKASLCTPLRAWQQFGIDTAASARMVIWMCLLVEMYVVTKNNIAANQGNIPG